MAPIDWEKRALKAEGRLVEFLDKTVNPPVCISHLDFQKKFEAERKKVREFRHIWHQLYWRRPS